MPRAGASETGGMGGASGMGRAAKAFLTCFMSPRAVLGFVQCPIRFPRLVPGFVCSLRYSCHFLPGVLEFFPGASASRGGPFGSYVGVVQICYFGDLLWMCLRCSGL